MTEPLSADEPWKLLVELRRLVTERTPADEKIVADFSARNRTIKKECEAAIAKATAAHRREKAAIEAQHVSVREAVIVRCNSDQATTQKQYEDVRQDVLQQFQVGEERQKTRLQEARWEATTVFEATKDGPDKKLQEIKAWLTERRTELSSIEHDAVLLLRRRRQWRDYPQPDVQMAQPADPMNQVSELITRAKEQLLELHHQHIPGLFEGSRPIGLLLLILLLAACPAALAFNWDMGHWIPLGIASIVTALAFWGGLSAWLYRVAARQSAEGYTALRQTLTRGALASQHALEAATADCRRQRAAINRRLHDELRKADENFARAMPELERHKQQELREIDEKYPALLAERATRRDRELQEADQDCCRRLEDADQRYEQESDRLLEQYARLSMECEGQFQGQWGALAQRWQSGMADLLSRVDLMNSACASLFPDWNVPNWKQWGPPSEMPATIPFGRFDVHLSEIEGGIPKEEKLLPERTDFSMPAMFSYGDYSLILFRARGEGRAEAIQALQAVMLRMLTSLPPGKVRFTIVDPVGLGENFSAFMHLADYDEQLVSSRIWTETAHIEQRLADLTEHMENVLQVYLRNEFETIQAYNTFAGEMAEPYRVLVVANFPANFSERAAARLASIVASGARCGVYTLMSVDSTLPMPRDFSLGNLLPQAVNLSWHEGCFVWDHADYGKLPVILSSPPPPGKFTDIVRAVAEKVEDAGRVEVPFDCIVPPSGKWWTSDSGSGIDVPLGRAGAMKLQHLQLGKGTAQHVLISGRTGSGKSTLLHALITNAALYYSPDQVEMYLVDFKKGVEFKAFASTGLPHARVIAIESEREFGLSVLERLDLELKNRGDLFRRLNVQDLQGFRRIQPGTKMPRVLLIIDEFQELFVEDDRISQNASQLLDRLVRQGRAFGIHVLLGSQTLAGAYSLPRSTMGQMGVRIALQCSESDAHLILSEENTAARLLSRPGEAIYNDANGLFEGNHPFQVVWLPDDTREVYLRKVRQLAHQRNCLPEPAIVFEGNMPADANENPLLRGSIAAPSWNESAGARYAWLGSSVAIKDPAAAVFRRQSGNNLLLVGQQEEAAMGILATVVVSLAAQDPPCGPNNDGPGSVFHVLDGTRPDAPEAGFWKRFAPTVPHTVRVVRPSGAGESIAEVAAEVSRREHQGLEDAPPIYLIIYNLVRFRDLRKADDDFSFARMDEDKPPSLSAQLATILREGPALGVHTLIWCDTYNNLARWVDRQTLRDMEMRVLFQMNDSDSTSLIDSPAAGRLGVNRAVIYNEEEGRLEKFRPYGMPSEDWLEWVKRHLHQRADTDSPRPA